MPLVENTINPKRQFQFPRPRRAGAEGVVRWLLLGLEDQTRQLVSQIFDRDPA